MNPDKKISPIIRLLLFIGLMLGGMLLGSLLSFFSIIPFKGINGFSEVVNYPESNVGLIKLLQIIQAICLFIIPAFLFAKMVGGNTISYLHFNKKTDSKAALIIIITMIAAIPFINLLGEINSKMVLPSFLSNIEDWMKMTEERAADLTMVLVSGKSIFSIVINLLMIAILPAIGEEMVFRGILQRILIDSFKNTHIAIIFTALIFSAFHLQFYGFLPRFFLGLIMGYLYVASGSLWLPILAHFVNNATATIFYFLFNNGLITENIDTLGTNDGQIIGALSAGILLIIYFYIERHKTELQLNEFK